MLERAFDALLFGSLIASVKRKFNLRKVKRMLQLCYIASVKKIQLQEVEAECALIIGKLSHRS
jgi:hypothetical protein